MCGKTLRAVSRRLVLSAFVLVALGSVGRGASITIDDFESPSPGELFMITGPAPFGTPNPTLLQHSSPGVVGGERDALVDVLGALHPGAAIGVIGMNPVLGSGRLQMATAGRDGSSVTLQYDGADAESGGGLVNAHGMFVDLTDGGANDSLEFQFMTTDGGNVSGIAMMVQLTSPGGGTADFTGLVPDSSAPQTYSIPFSSFVLAGTGSLSAVDGITIVFNPLGRPNMDFELDQIRAVPEPSACVLFALAIAGFGFLGRSRKGM